LNSDGDGSSLTGVGGDISFGGDTFGADKTIGANDAYALSFETSGNVAMKIDSAGQITMPLQPAFSVSIASDQENFTAGGGDITIDFDTEQFDINADFNLTNATFTAPVTGKYQMNGNFYIQDGDNAAGYWKILINTSNKSYSSYSDPRGLSTDPSSFHTCVVVLADMDAGDTATCTFKQYGGATQTDIQGANTQWSGYLAC
jgi:hypothetical protein